MKGFETQSLCFLSTRFSIKVKVVRAEIEAAEDKARFLPFLMFGDDGTLRKSRTFATLTWFSALATHEHCLQSRFPFYVIAKHELVPGMTECDLQRAIVWAFDVWMTGKHPALDPQGNAWSDKRRLSLAGSPIAGGHIPVYCGCVADQDWIAQHYRFLQKWDRVECCHRCMARTGPGPLTGHAMRLRHH